MNPAITISIAGETDAEAIRELAVTVWNACYTGIISQEQIDYMLGWMYAPEKIRKEIREDGIIYLRIDDPSGLRGFAAFGPAEKAAEGFIHKLYIDPEFQGRGLGSAAIREIEVMSRHQGVFRISLRVNRKNLQAIGAYEKNGFCRCGKVCSDIGGGFEMDDFLLAKNLD